MKKELQTLKIKFIAKLGSMGKYQDGEDKFHVIIPRRYIDQVRKNKGQDIRIQLDDEI